MKDIVTQLRTNSECLAPSIMLAAADEIERLREQLRLANIDNFNTTAEVERLRAERDEARRKICEMEAECIVYPPCNPQQYAVRMGWDCYKENA